MTSFKVRFEKRAEALGTRKVYVPGAAVVDVPANVRDKFKSAGAAVFAYGRALIDDAAGNYAAIVLESIYFMQYGVSGAVSFSALVSYARNAGMLVICDERLAVKEANASYAALAFLTDPTGKDLSETGRIPLEEHGFNADALTVSAECSEKGLERLSEAASASGREIMTVGPNGVLKGILSGLELSLN
ncbi:MAG: hypothetical protein J5950_00915 [Clostridia bacterium]|nr:hypothetical protein [Clostridia bacterium]